MLRKESDVLELFGNGAVSPAYFKKLFLNFMRRLNKALRDAEIAHRSAPKLLDRSVQPIYKMQNLAEELAMRDMDGEPLTRENYGELMDRIDAYLSEFDEHGTDNISVDLP